MILELTLALTLQRAPSVDPWFGADKAKHFFLSAFVQSVAYSTLRSTRLSPAASTAGATIVWATVSVSKELSDPRQGRSVSPRDLSWDAAGAATASLLLRRADR